MNFVVGRKISNFNRNMLPSKKDVLARLLYLVQDENKNVKESASIVTNELIEIYNLFEIPTKRKDSINQQMILRLHDEYKNIRKSKNNVRPRLQIEEKSFIDSLDVLFDVSHVNAMTSLRKHKKQEAINFLNDHRESMVAVRRKLCLDSDVFIAPALVPSRPPATATSSTSRASTSRVSTSTSVPGQSTVSNVDVDSDLCVPSCSYTAQSNEVYSEVEEAEQESGDSPTDTDIETTEIETTEMETEGSTYVPPRKIVRYKQTEPIQNVIDTSMIQALDRFKIPNNAASVIIGQIAYILGHDVRSLFISPEYIRMQRIKFRTEIYNTIRKQFSTNAVFTVHWDGKVLDDCTNVNQLTCNRLAIILSSNGNSKVLGIPKVASQTGVDEATAVYSALLDWNVQDNVMAMCFDTTSSNTSTSIGACVVLQQKLSRRLLYFACRHHVMELLVTGAFEATVEPVTSGPNILLFERFRKAWPDLDHDNYESGISDAEVAKYFPADVRMDLINFINDQIQNKVDKTRHDYIEFLKLSLLFLGEKIPQYKIPKVGAISRARWMGKNIYSLKIFMFRKQFKLSGK